MNIYSRTSKCAYFYEYFFKDQGLQNVNIFMNIFSRAKDFKAWILL